MANQEYTKQGEPRGLTPEDLCGGPIFSNHMRHVPEPEFSALVCNLHHQLELQHHLLSNMKADFDQKWDHREGAMQEQLLAQRRELANVFNEERWRAHVINHSSSFTRLRGGSPSGPSGLASMKSTTCRTLGSDGKGEMVTIAEYRAWAFRARAWYFFPMGLVATHNINIIVPVCTSSRHCRMYT